MAYVVFNDDKSLKDIANSKKKKKFRFFSFNLFWNDFKTIHSFWCVHNIIVQNNKLECACNIDIWNCINEFTNYMAVQSIVTILFWRQTILLTIAVYFNLTWKNDYFHRKNCTKIFPSSSISSLIQITQKF